MNNYPVSTSCQIKDLDSIYRKYFNFPSKGFFVEVGAYDGYTCSNTSCLADIGWSGLYIEPITEYFDLCRQRHKNNNVTVLNNAVGTIESQIDMYVGGVLSTSDQDQVNRYSQIDWAKNTDFKLTQVNQLKLETILSKFNVKPNFDILCVDVEGKESDVFNSFDLSYWMPKMLIVELEDEHDSFKKYEDHVANIKKLRSLIIQHGYVEIYKDEINTIFSIKN